MGAEKVDYLNHSVVLQTLAETILLDERSSLADVSATLRRGTAISLEFDARPNDVQSRFGQVAGRVHIALMKGQVRLMELIDKALRRELDAELADCFGGTRPRDGEVLDMLRHRKRDLMLTITGACKRITNSLNPVTDEEKKAMNRMQGFYNEVFGEFPDENRR